MSNRLISFCSILLILSLACNLPGAISPNSSAPNQPTATPDPFPIIDPVTLPITSLNANLNLRIESGEWTLEEGLIASLKLLVGETALTDVNPSGKTILSLEGSGMVARATAYLQDGADEATKIELTRLIGLIFPDPARLDRYSAASVSSPRLGKLLQPGADCEQLWAEGLPDDTGVRCFDVRSIIVGGQEYKLYTPEGWAATDPRRALFDPIMQAVEASVNMFQTYGPMPPAILVFTFLPFFDEEGRFITDVGAATMVPEDGGKCQIALYSVLTDVPVEIVQQTVAHEMFHCFQYNRDWAKTINYAPGAWWIEGTAEYFSNVVYPNVNAEAGFWEVFDGNSITMPLLDMDYESEVFFQYLANQNGNDSVIGLTDAMPSSGGRASQLSALSAYPGIEELFHEFAKAYFDADIEDTGGGPIGIDPEFGDTHEFSTSRTESIHTQPFLLARAILRFPEGTRHTVSEEDTDDIRTTARPRDQRGAWAPLPTEVVASCAEQAYIYVATTTASGSSGNDPKVRSEVEDSENECDECLIGEWQVDVQSHAQANLALMQASGGNHLQLQSVGGAISAQFTEDGYLLFLFQGYTVNFTMDIADTHTDATLTMDGLWQGQWYSDGDGSGTFYALNPTSQPHSNQHITMTLSSGGSFSEEKTYEDPMASGGPSLYQCNGDTLLVDSSTPVLGYGQFVPWLRIP